MTSTSSGAPAVRRRLDIGLGLAERLGVQQLQIVAPGIGNAVAFPLADGLALDAAHPGHLGGPAEDADGFAVAFDLGHTAILGALTKFWQVNFTASIYVAAMKPPEPATAAERIAWAIERSGKTLRDLAAKVGCSHAALSQWQTGRVDVSKLKAGYLQAFADETGVDVRWILTGEGPVISRYLLRPEIERVAAALQAMERTAPQQVETVVRMVE